MMTIGERIRELRIQKGITQTELSNAINTTKQNLYKYENNIITNIPSDKIEAIAKYLNISPSYLMGWTDTLSRTANVDNFSLSDKEKQLVKAYRNHPEMQTAIDKMLDITDTDFEEVEELKHA